MDHLRFILLAGLVSLASPGCDRESDSTDEIIEESAEGRAKLLRAQEEQVDDIEEGADLMGGGFERETNAAEAEFERAAEEAEAEAERLEEAK